VNLEELGWSDFFENQLAPEEQHLVKARVIRQDLAGYQLDSNQGLLVGSLPGKFRHDAESKSDLPTVGDWVLVSLLDGEPEKAVIARLLDRRTRFSRKEVGEQLDQQIIAANIDIVFIVCGLDDNFNIRRIERYLFLAWESQAIPHILLNKADLCDDVDEKITALSQVTTGVEISIVSAFTGQGIDLIRERITIGKTGALLGSSGVGKSTIINALLGFKHFQTGSVRDGDSKGRHTTTHREMARIPDQGLLIDTPGMREIQIWGDESSLSGSFDDLETLANQCKFRNCSHLNEPGCAVKEAVESGTLSEDRLLSFKKFQRELKHLAEQQDIRARLEKKSGRKRLSRMIRKRPTRKDIQ
jgi:ribosome biogenesis GTPase